MNRQIAVTVFLFSFLISNGFRRYVITFGFNSVNLQLIIPDLFAAVMNRQEHLHVYCMIRFLIGMHRNYYSSNLIIIFNFIFLFDKVNTVKEEQQNQMKILDHLIQWMTI